MSSTALRVTAAIIRRGDGAIFVARRAPGRRLAGAWEFPGGKIEPGETPEACLARELREELDLEVQVGAHFATSVHDDGVLAVELMAYEVAILRGVPRPVDHDEVAWVAPHALRELALAEADVPIADELAGRARPAAEDR